MPISWRSSSPSSAIGFFMSRLEKLGPASRRQGESWPLLLKAFPGATMQGCDISATCPCATCGRWRKGIFSTPWPRTISSIIGRESRGPVFMFLTESAIEDLVPYQELRDRINKPQKADRTLYRGRSCGRSTAREDWRGTGRGGCEEPHACSPCGTVDGRAAGCSW